MLPHIISNFNLFIDGKGLAGLAEEITLPKLEQQTEELNAAGMAGPVEIDMCLSALSLSFTLDEFNADVLSSWGLSDPSGINARFLGAAVAGDGSDTDAVEISVRGRWKSLDFGTVKKKEIAKLKVEMPLTYYRYSVNGSALIEIDMLSGKEIVNGTDLTSDILNALSINA